MTDEKKKDKKEKKDDKDAKKIDDEQLKDVAGGTRGHEAAHVVQQKDGTETKKKNDIIIVTDRGPDQGGY